MPAWFAALAVAGLLCSAVAATAEAEPKATSDGAVIEVMSTAIVSVPPDFATVAVTVVTTDETSVSATLRNEREVARVIAFAAASGAASSDITSDPVRMAPHRKPVPPGSAAPPPAAGTDGFDATTNLRVRWNDLAKAEAFSRGAVENGATRVMGTTYGVLDEVAAADTARQAAFSVARRKAENLAAIAGLTLGPLVRVAIPPRSWSPLASAAAASGRPGEPLGDDVVRVPSNAPKGVKTTDVRVSIEAAWSAK